MWIHFRKKEVDVDFVRKSVRAIGRCAIKVEQSAKRCVSSLPDLIQTKVNYVAQEAVVVIKDIPTIIIGTL
jgi:vesicle coat complex subunit